VATHLSSHQRATRRNSLRAIQSSRVIRHSSRKPGDIRRKVPMHHNRPLVDIRLSSQVMGPRGQRLSVLASQVHRRRRAP
jgi:hypothetical protein